MIKSPFSQARRFFRGSGFSRSTFLSLPLGIFQPPIPFIHPPAFRSSRPGLHRMDDGMLHAENYSKRFMKNQATIPDPGARQMP
jgi:hypothetical protein